MDLLLFRDFMNQIQSGQIDRPLEAFLSDKEQIAEFVPPLMVKRNLDGNFCLRNFTLLLFGKRKSITLKFQEAFTSISVYNGTDRSETTAEQHLLTGSIIEQAKRAVELLSLRAYTVFDKTSDKPNQVLYPMRALAEGQGIPTIFKTMRAEGCPAPVFQLGVDSVTCILPAHPRHKMSANNG